MAARHFNAVCFLTMGTLISSITGASAAPLVCTSIYNKTSSGTELESNTCQSIETQNERIDEEIYTWRPPYSSGIGVFQGIAEDLGLAFGGINGTHFVGIGYPDQTIVWDGGILQKSVQELLELQTEPLPLRTADLPNAFESSLANTNTWEATTIQTSTDRHPIGAQPLW